jgi:Tat protein translocase TatB subunit
MDVFGIGAPELLVILVIALIVLGPERLPDMARTIGRTVYEFRKVTREATSVFQEVIDTAQYETTLSPTGTPPEPRQPNGLPYPMDNTGVHPMFRRDATGNLPSELVLPTPPAPETPAAAPAAAPSAAAPSAALWYPEPGDPTTPPIQKPQAANTLDYPAPFSE